MAIRTHGTALVTGASSGIGAVYADRLARRGFNLVLVARDQARMQALAAQLRKATGREVEVVPADLTDRRQLAAVSSRFATDRELSLLVNNAGMALEGTLATASPEQVEQLLLLNVTAPTVLAGAAVRAFIARKSGTIVNVSSILAFAPERFDGVYSGSKAFVLNLSISLAKEVGAGGVRIQAVLPGPTRTEIWARSGKDVSGFPPEWVMEPTDLVDAALAGLDRGETVTIPTLQDEGLWDNFESARAALQPQLVGQQPAARYREPAEAMLDGN
jgi:uncharacterized protein